MGADFYTAAYFARQREVGQFGGEANRSKFERFVGPRDVVLDFGCGGGFLLARLDCARRIGVEINRHAAREALERQIEIVTDFEGLDPATVDVVISDNALEHVEMPLLALRGAHRVLKPGGIAVFVVPCESILTPDKGPRDPDQHLYSWSPGALANLFRRADFDVLSCKPFIHRWPPQYAQVQRALGWPLFHLVCRAWAMGSWRIMQVRIVARKPDP